MIHVVVVRSHGCTNYCQVERDQGGGMQGILWLKLPLDPIWRKEAIALRYVRTTVSSMQKFTKLRPCTDKKSSQFAEYEQ
jgi:hypothetical protein